MSSPLGFEKNNIDSLFFRNASQYIIIILISGTSYGILYIVNKKIKYDNIKKLTEKLLGVF